MDTSKMKNMIVLKNLPSNLVDEAIIILKENKLIKKYQYIETKQKAENKNVNTNVDKVDYIVKEAENIVNQYITNMEKKSPKWKNDIKKLEKSYKKSVRLNIVLGFITLFAITISLI